MKWLVGWWEGGMRRRKYLEGRIQGRKMLAGEGERKEGRKGESREAREREEDGF